MNINSIGLVMFLILMITMILYILIKKSIIKNKNEKIERISKYEKIEDYKIDIKVIKYLLILLTIILSISATLYISETLKNPYKEEINNINELLNKYRNN